MKHYIVPLCITTLLATTGDFSPSLAQTDVTTDINSIPTQIYDIQDHRLTLPDWSQITWADMRVEEAGSLQIPAGMSLDYNPSRNWSAGDSLDSVIMLGDLEADGFNIGSLSLNDVSQMKLANSTSINNASSEVVQLLQSQPDRPFSSFPGWRQWFVKDIPDLNQAPLTELAPQLTDSLLSGIMAIADNYFSNAEHGDPKVLATQFVSGTATCFGETIPVAVPPSLPNAYVELTDFAGIDGPNYGKRFVSGDDQQVDGGCGPLAIVNDGKEPTGRSIPGLDDYKLVLRNISEQQSAEFWLYRHFCTYLPIIGKTCTPYFLPIMPIFSIQNNDIVPLGTGL